MVNFYVAKGFALKIGLQPGFLVNAKYKGNDIKDACETFNFSIPLGRMTVEQVPARWREAVRAALDGASD